MFDNGRRAATGTEDEQVVALADVLQRALIVTRQSRSRYDLDRASGLREQRGLLVCRAAIDASIDAAQDGAEQLRRLTGALDAVRRLVCGSRSQRWAPVGGFRLASVRSRECRPRERRPTPECPVGNPAGA